MVNVSGKHVSLRGALAGEHFNFFQYVVHGAGK
jgi:hypothetical protein